MIKIPQEKCREKFFNSIKKVKQLGLNTIIGISLDTKESQSYGIQIENSGTHATTGMAISAGSYGAIIESSGSVIQLSNDDYTGSMIEIPFQNATTTNSTNRIINVVGDTNAVYKTDRFPVLFDFTGDFVDLEEVTSFGGGGSNPDTTGSTCKLIMYQTAATGIYHLAWYNGSAWTTISN